MGFQSAALRSESAALGFCSAAFCRDAWFRVSLRDGGVYPGRRRARPSALRLGPHGLPALQTQRQVPPAPQSAAVLGFVDQDTSRSVLKLPRRGLEVRVPVWNCRARPVKCRGGFSKCRAPIRKCRARFLFCRVLPRCLVSRFLARWGCLSPSCRLAFVERVLPRSPLSRFLI